MNPVSIFYLRSWIAISVVVSCLIGSADLSAELIVNNLNQSTSLGEPDVYFDLDGDSEFDFFVEVDSEGAEFARIVGIQTPERMANVFGVESEADVFADGETVGPDLPSYGWGGLRELYFDDSGPFAEVGTTGFVGLRLFDNDSSEAFFGWAEITRGSVTVGSIGFQSTADTAAMINSSAVPEPSSLGFLGLAAFILVRRRRRIGL